MNKNQKKTKKFSPVQIFPQKNVAGPIRLENRSPDQFIAGPFIRGVYMCYNFKNCEIWPKISDFANFTERYLPILKIAKYAKI